MNKSHKNNVNCDFKQNQKLKRENEELKLELDFAKHLEKHTYNKAEEKLKKIEEYILQENRANRDLNENGEFIYGTIFQIIKGENNGKN